MTKQELLLQLRARLSRLPKRDVEERLSFYEEMIDDRMEEGLTEDAAVAALGTLDELVEQIKAEIPAEREADLQSEKGKKKWKPWEIVLLALGSPIWLSLLIAAVAIVFSLLIAVIAILLSLYTVLWAVVIALWAVFVSLIACGIGGFIGGIGLTIGGSAPSGVALIAAAFVCAGLSIFLFYACKAATKGAVLLASKIVIHTKKSMKRN